MTSNGRYSGGCHANHFQLLFGLVSTEPLKIHENTIVDRLLWRLIPPNLLVNMTTNIYSNNDNNDNNDNNHKNNNNNDNNNNDNINKNNFNNNLTI